VALVVDDAHWVDDASLRFLRYLAPRASELPLAIVVAGRPGADPGAWGELVDQPAALIRLAPLSPSGTARLVKSVSAAAGAELTAACHRLAGGNPLLVRELAAAARAAGGAAAAGDERALRALGGAALAQRMPALLANLTQPALRLAQACAVLGEEAAPHIVQGLTEAGERLADQRRELVDAGILSPGPQVAFRHALIRDAVYAGVDPVTRSRLHRRAAGLLVADGQPVALAASHLLATLPAADGWVVTTLISAARDAAHRASPRSALAFLERAIQEPAPDRRTAAELIRLAGRVAQGVDWESAIRYLRRAAALTEDIAERAEITELLGRAMFLAFRNAEAIALLERALSELNGAHTGLDHRLRSVIVAAAAADLDLRHTGSRHLAVLRAAPQLSVEVRQRLDALTALWAAAIDLDRASSVEAALRALRRRRDYAPDPGASSPLLAYVALVDADHDEALSELDRAWSAAHDGGSAHVAGLVAAFRAYALLGRGDLAAADEDARTAMALTSTPLATLSRVYAGVFRAEVHLARGRGDAALRALRWATAAGRPGPVLQVQVDMFSARLDLAEGRAEAAVRRAEDVGRRLAADGWSNPAIWPWRTVAALGRYALDQHDSAREVAAEELDLARRWGAPRALSRALRVMARVTGGRSEADLLEEAVRVVRHSPARLELATALHAFGGAIRVRHPEAARTALSEALRLAWECSADELARQAGQALVDLGAETLAPAHARLTPAEWRVARLAAAGRTNHEVAQDLHVTPKTVETHLTSVYRKLGVRNRTAMARVLAEANPDRVG
jgi:DNA-binding CsgD family transcriptional regulator